MVEITPEDRCPWKQIENGLQAIRYVLALVGTEKDEIDVEPGLGNPWQCLHGIGLVHRQVMLRGKRAVAPLLIGLGQRPCRCRKPTKKNMRIAAGPTGN